MRLNRAACKAAGGVPPDPEPTELRLPKEYGRMVAPALGYAKEYDSATREYVIYKEEDENE